MPRISFAIVDSYANVLPPTTVWFGEDHQLVVVVGVGLIEASRDGDTDRCRIPREALADGRAAAGDRAAGAQIDGLELAGAPGRQADDRAPQSDAGPEMHLDGAVREQHGLDGHRLRRLEAADAAPRDGRRIGRRFRKTRPLPVVGSRSAKNGATRGGPVRNLDTLRSELAVSLSPKVMLPSELTKARVCDVPKNGNANGTVNSDASSS